ncbi:MAG: hypothetical protein SOY94_01390 [Candidatus Limiplasma sp.]|nr:hypothetical protein [Candidatus Limiplasma sp.]
MSYWEKKEKAKVTAPEAEPTTDSLEAVEKETVAELTEVENSFRERMKVENKRFRDMCDTEYWFCVCFTSREQKEEFLQKIGMDTDLKYIEGKDMARAYRKAIQTPDMEFAKVRPFDSDFCNRVRTK